MKLPDNRIIAGLDSFHHLIQGITLNRFRLGQFFMVLGRKGSDWVHGVQYLLFPGVMQECCGMENVPALIAVKGGHFALVDVEDVPRVSGHSWYLNETGYAISRIGNKLRRMHRWILNNPDGVVDHKNRNTLDNRKSNLRITTHRNNSRNSGKRNKKRKTTSQYKGVHWDKSRDKWRCSVWANYRQHYTGSFVSEKDAGLAYNLVAGRLHGEFAGLNQIDASEEDIRRVTEMILMRKNRGGILAKRDAPPGEDGGRVIYEHNP